jgi:DNA-binding NtrC family response regulator
MSEAAVIARHSVSDTSVPTMGSVLIIDDEAAIRESLQTLLEMDGYTTETAESGKEGLTRAGEKPFDLILLDVALPDANGIDLLAELRQRDPNLPVIIITAYGTVENAVRAIRGRELCSEAMGQ